MIMMAAAHFILNLATQRVLLQTNYLKHLLGGIQYAIGDNKALDYSKAKHNTHRKKSGLLKRNWYKASFFEPTEMTILPNLDILIIQRRGEVLLYKGYKSK